MEQYIPKSALLVEIERLKDELKASDSAAYVEAYIIGAEHTIRTISDVIDTLEVKEVDLEKDLVDYHNKNFSPCNDGTLLSCETGAELAWCDYERIAKHFFELGMSVNNKAQKGE